MNATVVRLPPSVHDETKLGLVTWLIEIARKKRISAYPGDGLSRWAAVHTLDASRLFRLALENGEPGASYHCAAEEGIPFRDIADAIGCCLDCVFHTKLDSDFAASWTGISREAGDGFHGKLDSDFTRSWTVAS
ncbi:hypothetical protein [Paraburkholderia tropica]|uniref:hypothetical protein n=1 Tax=Paraburkholderia tropica TaxID=92647 RepID=UPI003D28CCE9